MGKEYKKYCISQSAKV